MDNIIFPIITTIVGTVVGTLISKFLFTEELSSKYESQSKNDHILQYNKQNVIIINSNNKIGYNQNRNKNKSTKEKSDQDIFILLFMGLFIGLILVGLYLKYQTQISNILLVSTLFITSTSLSAIYYITKRKINIDKHFKLNLIWIVIAAIFVPIILYYSTNPFYLNNINNQQILNVMETKGSGALLTEYGFNTFSFLLYQVIGIIAAIIFILHLLIGSLHSWSIINLYIDTRFKNFWSFIFQRTNRTASSSFIFIGLNSLFLLISFIMSSGLLYKFILYISTKSIFSF